MHNPLELLLLEACTTFKDRREAREMLLENTTGVNSALVTSLYQSMLQKDSVDFGQIPDSRGDVTKFKGYETMRESMRIVEELAQKQGVKVNEVAVVNDALDILVAHRNHLEKGFQLDKEFIILQYNYIVLACMTITSAPVASYVDYMKRVDRTELVLQTQASPSVTLLLKDVQMFNQQSKSGKYGQSLKAMVDNGKENFIGADGVSLAFLTIGAAALIVPLMREMVFVFYYSRMRVSDMLDQQAKFLEVNRQSVEALSASAKERNAILKRQSNQIEKLRRMSDRIKVDYTMSDNKAKVDIVKQNREFSVEKVRSQMAEKDATGFQLL